jgi:hypothetical protein
VGRIRKKWDSRGTVGGTAAARSNRGFLFIVRE